CSAAAMKLDNTPVFLPSAILASASERASSTFLSEYFSLPRAIDSSTDLAMKMVQVTNEAKASPIMTACTMISADRNIDHGDNSRGTCSATGFAALALSAGASAD